MKFDKKLEREYEFYLKQVDSKATKEDFRNYLRKSNPNAMQEGLTLYLQQFFFDVVDIIVLEKRLQVKVKNRGELEFGLITAHYFDIPMLYSVSTEEAVRLLSHVWYSYKNGFDLARMTGFWEFPDKLEGSRVLHYDSPIPQISSFILRTSIDDILVAAKGTGKSVYLDKLSHLSEVEQSYEYVFSLAYRELPHPTWVSALEVLPYTSESTVNTQVCVRPFITVEVI